MREAMREAMRIDNTGQGNCMYYAYGISLMYFLLKKQDPETAEFVFNQLKLSTLQQRRLNALLNNKSITEFTTRQIKQIIEPILAPAAREAAAEQTKLVFLQGIASNQVDASSVYTALCYGMVYLFRQAMLQRKAHDANILKENDFSNPTFTQAEIYQLFPIKSPVLQQYIAEEYDAIMEAFQNDWDAKAQEISMHTRRTVANIKGDRFYKKEYLEALINNKTSDFFTKNNNFRLDQYIAHLKTNFKWGNEESLLLLHAYVQGTPRIETGPENFSSGRDHPIEMDIYVNGRPKPGNPIPNPDMVLNNEWNTHWTSLVTLSSPSSAYQPSQSQEETRIGLLRLSGFTVCLDQLETYAAEIYREDEQAGSPGFQLVEALKQEMESFLAVDSGLSKEAFCNSCQAIIGKSELSLEQNSGFGKLLNMMLNALIFIPNVLIGLGNLFYGKFVLIDYDRLKPDSITMLNKFKTSFTAVIDNNNALPTKHTDNDATNPKKLGP